MNGCRDRTVSSALMSSLLLAFIFLLFPSVSVHAKSVESLVKDGWVGIKTPNFHVISDADEENVKSFAWDLEAFRAVIPLLLNREMGLEMKMKANVPPLTVFAIKNAANFKALDLGSNYRGMFFSHLNEGFAVAGLQGYVKGSKVDNFARQVMLHEYVHYMMRNSTTKYNYPVWYTEGMADFLSTVVVDGDLVRYGLQSKARVLSVQGRGDVPVERIFKTTGYPKHRDASSSFYAYSWMLLHYFSQDRELWEKTKKYIGLWQQGVAVDTAFSTAYGMSYWDMGRLVRFKYVKRNYQFKEMKLTPPFTLMVDSPRKLEEHEIAYQFGRLQLYRSARGEDQEKRKASGFKLLEYAIELNPDNAQANALLWGRDIQREQNFDELGKDIAEFYKRNDKSSEVASVYGDWLRQKASKLTEFEGFGSDETVKAARGKYRRAIYFDKANINAYIGVARIYREHGKLFTTDEEVAEAVSVNEELVHWLDSGFYRYHLAYLYELQGKTKEAQYQLQIVSRGKDVELARLSDQKLSQLGRIDSVLVSIEDNATPLRLSGTIKIDKKQSARAAGKSSQPIKHSGNIVSSTHAPIEGDTKRFVVSVGGNKIEVVSPSKFHEISSLPLSPAINSILRLSNVPENRTLATLVSEGAVGKILRGEIPNLHRRMVLVTPRRTEYIDMFSDSFSELPPRFLEEQMGMSSVNAKRRISDAGEKISEVVSKDIQIDLSANVFLGTFLDQANALGGVSLMKYTFHVAGETKIYVVAGAIVNFIVNERLVSAYVYSEFNSQDDIDWVKASSKAWVEDIISLNQ